jgi:hypothetical protein
MPLPLKYLFQHATDIGQSRSSVVNPLQWACAIVGSVLLLAVASHAPTWLVIMLAAIFCATFVLFTSVYVFFMLKNPDALRSEHYSLSKMAMEKGLVGDSISGLREATTLVEPFTGRNLPLPEDTTPQQAEKLDNG